MREENASPSYMLVTGISTHYATFTTTSLVSKRLYLTTENKCSPYGLNLKDAEYSTIAIPLDRTS